MRATVVKYAHDERLYMRIIRIAATFFALAGAGTGLTNTTLGPAKASTSSVGLQDKDAPKPLQRTVASKTAKFATMDKTDSAYKDALDAHDLVASQKLVGKAGSFRGTVSKLFEERDGDLVVLDFDPNYKTALTAVLKNADFPKFPDLSRLVGKEVVVSGTFVDYQGRAQIVLTDPGQIKLVE
jgi:hypothetical protein